MLENPPRMNNYQDKKYSSFAHYEQKKRVSTCSNASSTLQVPNSKDSGCDSPAWNDDPDLEVVRVCSPPAIDSEFQLRTIENTMEDFRVKSLDVFSRNMNDDFIIKECYPRLKTINEALISVTCEDIKDIARTSVEKIFNFIYRLTVSDEFLEDERWFDTLALCITLSLKLMLTREEVVKKHRAEPCLDPFRFRNAYTMALIKNLHMQLFYCCKKNVINILSTLIRVPILPNQLQVHILAKLLRLNLQNIDPHFPLTSKDYIVLILSYKKMNQLNCNVQEFTDFVTKKLTDSVIPDLAVRFINDRYTMVGKDFSLFLLNCPDTDIYLYKQFVKFKDENDKRDLSQDTNTDSSTDLSNCSDYCRRKISAVCETDEHLDICTYMTSACSIRKYHPIEMDQKCPCRTPKHSSNTTPPTNSPHRRRSHSSSDVEIIESTKDILIVISDSEDESDPVAPESVSTETNLLPDIERISLNCTPTKDTSPNTTKTPLPYQESDNIINLCDSSPSPVGQCDTELSEPSEHTGVSASDCTSQSNQTDSLGNTNTTERDSTMTIDNISITDLIDSTIDNLPAMLSSSTNSQLDDSLSEYLDKSNLSTDKDMKNSTLETDSTIASQKETSTTSSNISMISPIRCSFSINNTSDQIAVETSNLIESAAAQEMQAEIIESEVQAIESELKRIEIVEAEEILTSEVAEVETTDSEVTVVETVPETVEVVSETVEDMSERVEVVPETFENVSETVEVVPETFEVVSEIVENVSETVEVVSETVEDVSKTAEVVSETIKDVSETVEIESETVLDVSETVEVVPEIAADASEVVAPASPIIEVVSETVKDVSKTAEVVSETIEDESETVLDVSETVEVVSEIVANAPEVVTAVPETIESTSEVVKIIPEIIESTEQKNDEYLLIEENIIDGIKNAIEPENREENEKICEIELELMKQFSDDQPSKSESELNPTNTDKPVTVSVDLMETKLETLEVEITEVVPSDQIEVSEINIPISLEEETIVDDSIENTTSEVELDPLTNAEAVLDALLKQHSEGTLLLNETKNDYDDDTNSRECNPEDIPETDQATSGLHDVDECVNEMFKGSLFKADVNEAVAKPTMKITILHEEIITPASITQNRSEREPEKIEKEKHEIELMEQTVTSSSAQPSVPLSDDASPPHSQPEEFINPKNLTETTDQVLTTPRNSSVLVTKGSLKEYSDQNPVVEDNIEKSTFKFKTKLFTKKMKMLRKNGVSVNLVKKIDDKSMGKNENLVEAKNETKKRPVEDSDQIPNKKAKIITDVTNSPLNLSPIKTDEKRPEISLANHVEKQEVKGERIDSIAKKLKSTKFEFREETSRSILTNPVPIYNGFKSKKNRTMNKKRGRDSDEGAATQEELKRNCLDNNIPAVVNNGPKPLVSAMKSPFSKRPNNLSVKFNIDEAKEEMKTASIRPVSPPPYDLKPLILEPKIHRKVDFNQIPEPFSKILQFAELEELEKELEREKEMRNQAVSVITSTEAPVNGFESINHVNLVPNAIKDTPHVSFPTPEFPLETLLINYENNSLVPYIKESANKKNSRQNKNRSSVPVYPPLPKTAPPLPPPPPPPPPLPSLPPPPPPPTISQEPVEVPVPETNSQNVNPTKELPTPPEPHDWSGLSLIRDVTLEHARIQPYKENDIRNIEPQLENDELEISIMRKSPILGRKRNEKKKNKTYENRIPPLIIKTNRLRKSNEDGNMDKKAKLYKKINHKKNYHQVRFLQNLVKYNPESDRDKIEIVKCRAIVRKTDDNYSNGFIVSDGKPKNETNYSNELYSPISSPDDMDYEGRSYENGMATDMKTSYIYDMNSTMGNIFPSPIEGSKPGDSEDSTASPISETEGEFDLLSSFMTTSDSELQYTNSHSSIGTDNDILNFTADDNYCDIIAMVMPDATEKNEVKMVQQTTKTGVINVRDPCLGQLDALVTETARLHNL